MQVVWKNDSNEAKLLEEKRKEMNKLIWLNNISIKENITLLISDWCAEHIKQLHKEYPNEERLAVCKVEPQWNWVFLMTDMVFPWQKTTGWDVETTEEWMERLNKELLSRNERGTQWNCILHSHHNMWVFRSTTDDNARLWMNDGRQMERAVVTAYDKDKINYKGCINFYKPYNIEIDVQVKDADDISIINKYNEYLVKLKEEETSFYDKLVDENKEYIDSITNKPSYSRLLEYLWVDISEELNENYEKVKDKVWNPELLDYLKQLWEEANRLAVEKVNENWQYSDMLAEYSAFCEWSDNLLTQLEENKKVTKTVYSPPLISSTAYPTNRYLEDEYEYGYEYYYTTWDFDEYYVRQTFWIGDTVPMKAWKNNEWQAWSTVQWKYVYVEERANDYYGYGYY